MTKQSKQQNRRYYLHQRIKEKYRYNPHTRTVFVKWNQELVSHARELAAEFRYNIQFESTKLEVMNMLQALAEDAVVYLEDLALISRMELHTLIDMVDCVRKRMKKADNAVTLPA